MILRRWQEACIDLAIDFYCNKKHFLCLATPGAGKSTMAAELSARLILSDKIDFVLCFAPSLEVVSGLEKSFEKSLGRRFDGRIGAIGGAYTYQSMRSFKEGFWELFDSH
ncbi:DEAD/DEAH box helicase family protein [Hahella ganghwensis]|uniref:DEAD/DEAH box helicase family protein n=1 Tax=Hahella ganghwensis TaxID=286420 RepID=UPI0004773B9F|nr:DEAD/DEAH box helicase family protein [Hahella ganghwensis]